MKTVIRRAVNVPPTHVNRFGRTATLVALIMALGVANSRQSVAAGDAGRGEELYQGCMDCHSLDSNDVGPKHRDVFGRRAGSVADYRYSAALKSAGVVWNEDTLDKWLTNPDALVPGTKMYYLVPSPQDRADLIAFLKKAKSDQPAGDQRAGQPPTAR
ncbi:MAG: cytochrome c family protein [Xanthobacteraceae bacterium]|jgi:cytochrome c